MNYDYEETRFSKAILAGLATGVVAVVISLLYNFIFRDITKLSLNLSYINVTTIIFASFIFCMVAGIIYHAIVNYYSKPASWYVVTIIVLTALLLVPSFTFHRTDAPGTSAMFSELYAGVILMNGLLAAFAVPWYSSHKNYFFN